MSTWLCPWAASGSPLPLCWEMACWLSSTCSWRPEGKGQRPRSPLLRLRAEVAPTSGGATNIQSGRTSEHLGPGGWQTGRPQPFPGRECGGCERRPPGTPLQPAGQPANYNSHNHHVTTLLLQMGKLRHGARVPPAQGHRVCEWLSWGLNLQNPDCWDLGGQGGRPGWALWGWKSCLPLRLRKQATCPNCHMTVGNA